MTSMKGHSVNFSRYIKIFLVQFVALMVAPISWVSAQDSDSPFDEDKGAEQFYEQEDQKVEAQQQVIRKKEQEKKRVLPKVEKVSQLAELAPFSDVAVIQRKFLPRTGRFEFSGSGMGGLNNPFFNNMGVNLRGAYFLSEKWGIEANAMFFSSVARDVTNTLREAPLNVNTANLVTAKAFYGGAIKWVPIYGKIGFMNRKIVPFDLFFTGGGGVTQTQKQMEFTGHFGTGQSFAITKSFALRWDIIWNFYQATVDSVQVVGATQTTFNSDLFLSVGVSYFIPEATYR